MEFETLYWIGGIVVAFIIGNRIGAKGSKPGEKEKELENTIQTLKKKNEELEKELQKYKPGLLPQDVFLKNIDKFKPLLPALAKNNADLSKWSDIIVSINNKGLTEVWKAIVKKPNMLQPVLASWGVSCDNCKEFTYIKGREELYDNESGKKFLPQTKYQVLDSAWILTEPTGHKTILVKGKVKEISK